MPTPVTRYPLAGLIIVLLVTACGSQPTPRPEPTDDKPGAVDIPVVSPDDDSETTALLGSVERLLLERQLLPAASILTEIERSKLVIDLQGRHSLLSSRLHYLEGDLEAARNSLQPELVRLPDINAELRWQLQLLYLRLLSASGDQLAVARGANRWLADSGQADQHDYLVTTIWHSLQTSSLENLRSERLIASGDAHWRGWLELALIAARVSESPEVQVAEIQLWQQQNANHPLAATLPGGLELLSDLARSRPTRVALLLPLSNSLANAGQAVLDGYLATQYESRQRGWKAQQLLVLDTGTYADINRAYAAAVEMGAQLVIGPLTKEILAQWQSPPAANPPLLALNWFDQKQDSKPLYQLALAPEDEARQLAQLAFDEGARRALVIRPAGSWGDSMYDALSQHWRQLQGELAASAIYTGRNDYSSSIKEALNLAQSEQRARKIRQLMGTDVEFSPRRRQDVDSVFLLSGKPAEARSIKPLIAFHYAADLPVYATSHVFSGQPNPQQDRDLNGIRLVEIPWLLQQDRVRQTLNSNGAAETLASMYALGADAFLLHWRLGQLSASPNNSLRGYTGLLSMDARGRIHRELVAARFSGGVPHALER